VADKLFSLSRRSSREMMMGFRGAKSFPAMTSLKLLATRVAVKLFGSV
jgi:hypothetical protein